MVRKNDCMRRVFAVVVVWLSVFGCVFGQTVHVSVGFYNVENLFDTIPDPFRHDEEFTPTGARRWNAQRYQTKIRNLARVLDDCGFDVAGLAEVENEQVLRDLVMSLADDYNYIHRPSNDYRGMDVALIYKGDKFFPDKIQMIRSGTSRDFLYVHGRLAGVPTGIVVCHLPSKFNNKRSRVEAAGRLAAVADSLAATIDGNRLIVMGDFNGDMRESVMRKAFVAKSDGSLLGGTFRNALHECGRNGFGSYCYNGLWSIVDNILLSTPLTLDADLHLCHAGIFIEKYLLNTDGSTKRRYYGYPYRTFSAGNYSAGYSDHLPVYVILEM